MSENAFAALSSDELRAAVRAVLRDVLPAAVANGARAHVDGAIEQVSVGNDGDLDEFVRRLAALCDDPAQRAALRDGRRRFRLVPAPASSAVAAAATAPAARERGVIRVDRGAVTERRVKQAAGEGARLVIGPKAVLTPLARDTARTLGVAVEKEH
jgi:hypothetical protein